MDVQLSDIHPAIVSAVTSQAILQATLVGEYLKEFARRCKENGTPFDPNGLPAAFVLELAAALQLLFWDLEGLRPFLPPDLPTVDQAASNLSQQATTAPNVFSRLEEDCLGRKTLDMWLERFSWDAPSLLQADVVLGEADEDTLVEALAQLAWTHRHDSSLQPRQPE